MRLHRANNVRRTAIHSSFTHTLTEPQWSTVQTAKDNPFDGIKVCLCVCAHATCDSRADRATDHIFSLRTHTPHMQVMSVQFLRIANIALRARRDGSLYFMKAYFPTALTRTRGAKGIHTRTRLVSSITSVNSMRFDRIFARDTQRPPRGGDERTRTRARVRRRTGGGNTITCHTASAECER